MVFVSNNLLTLNQKKSQTVGKKYSLFIIAWNIYVENYNQKKNSKCFNLFEMYKFFDQNKYFFIQKKCLIRNKRVLIFNLNVFFFEIFHNKLPITYEHEK